MQMAEKIVSLQSHNNAAAYLLLLSHDQHLRSASSVGGYCSLPIRLLFLEKLNNSLIFIYSLLHPASHRPAHTLESFLNHNRHTCTHTHTTKKKTRARTHTHTNTHTHTQTHPRRAAIHTGPTRHHCAQALTHKPQLRMAPCREAKVFVAQLSQNWVRSTIQLPVEPAPAD